MEFVQKLSALVGVDFACNYPTSVCTGYGVGGVAKYYASVANVNALSLLINLAQTCNVDYKFLGNGTNVLVSDKGYNGLIISLKELNNIHLNSGVITSGGGALLCKVINFATANGLYGGEPISGIPASVGGAVVMNASAFGVCVADFISTVTTILDGKPKTYQVYDCDFGYRRSRFLHGTEPIISVDFKFYSDPKYKDLSKLNDCVNQRKLHQPNGKSCGCVFKNPDGDFAGRLIDQAGLKGLSIGGATVSYKHANFIVTGPNATATDVYNLIKYVKQKVYQKFNVLLKEEVEFIGEF